MLVNNQLCNVADVDRYANAKGETQPGVEQPLKSECGVQGEFTIDGWQAARTT